MLLKSRRNKRVVAMRLENLPHLSGPRLRSENQTRLQFLIRLLSLLFLLRFHLLSQRSNYLQRVYQIQIGSKMSRRKGRNLLHWLPLFMTPKVITTENYHEFCYEMLTLLYNVRVLRQTIKKLKKKRSSQKTSVNGLILDVSSGIVIV